MRRTGRLLGLGLDAIFHRPAAVLQRSFNRGSDVYTYRGLGLFGIKGLNHPQDFMRLLGDTQTRCDELLRLVLASDSNAAVVQLMDDLSDELCRTYDAAECCRNVHVDPEWRTAATHVCSELGAYISEVNHHAGMYEKLSATIKRYNISVAAAAAVHAPPPKKDAPPPGQPPASSSLPLLSAKELAAFDPETVQVGSLLCLDMEKAGIHLDEGKRARMQELMNLNNHYSMAYNQALTDPAKVGSITLESSPSSTVGGFFSGLSDQGSRMLTLDSGSVNNVLVSERNANLRKQVYMAASGSPKCNLQLLDEMIAARKEMASLVGCSSYSEYKAKNASLAQEPEAIVGFLSQLSSQIHGMADDEVKILKQYKVVGCAEASGGGFGGALGIGGGPDDGPLPIIFPWDTEYYMARARSDVCSVHNDRLSEYLNLGSVLEGVSDLLSQTFSVHLKVEPAPPAESWAPNVLKATAHHAELGDLGTVYLDLLFRPGKYPSAVTFPIRCGRSLESSSGRVQPDLTSKGGDYQLPIMALLCDFGGSTMEDAYLNYRELRVLLHELGHCMHNLLSRTRYQHLWGTRCAQDVVEVPSHLFEHFVSDHRTLRMLCRHRDTREPMPDKELDQLTAGRQLFSALDLQQQVLFSLVDQAYFGPDPPGPGQTSETWAKVAQQHSSIPYVPNTSPEARLGHLTVYGASYYSYVYARCLSSAIWSQHLAEDPLDKSQGDKIRKGLLQPGGSKPPLALMKDLLDDKALHQRPSGGWAPHPELGLLKTTIVSF